MLSELAAPISPGNLPEIQVTGPPPRSMESKILEVGPSNVFYTALLVIRIHIIVAQRGTTARALTKHFYARESIWTSQQLYKAGRVGRVSPFTNGETEAQRSLT